ncbi:MAG: hypothetical protein ABJ215_07600, partial [Alphaproteobacteria bacterium]
MLTAFAGLVALLAAPAWAQSGTPTNGPSNGQGTRDAGTLSHDCTEVTVDYADEPGLTREERIARMDRAFQRSLARFEECQSQRAGTGGGGGAGGASANGSTGSGAAGSESDGSEMSTAASDISGPDAQEAAPSA